MGNPANLTIEAANELLTELHNNQQQLLFSQKELFELSREAIAPVLRQTCQDIAKLMHCERVEIWLFDNDQQTTLLPEAFYDQNEERKISTTRLEQEKFPAYFDAVVNKRTLAVDNIQTHPAMYGLADHLNNEYTGVQSMLDASIVLSWGVGGVLCCLSETARTWTPIDRHMLASVADMLSFIFDRVHRQEAEQYIYELAYTDMLTGLHNQHAFDKKVTDKLKLLTPNERGVFIYLVLDQFTEIQGVLGHAGGEQVLIEVANRLREAFPAPAIIGRISFDHFVIYSPILINEEDVVHSMQTITEGMRAPMLIKDQEVYTTLSCGFSYYPDHVTDAKSGIQAAQVALQDARRKSSRKANGIYKPNMHAFMKENLLSEMNLRKGLDLQQFRLFYQPQVNCETGEVNGFEALIRWQHPERGLIFPADFINLAESTGLITIVGEWVIEEACAQLKRWQDEGKNHFTISVNISPKHFLDARLPRFLIYCLQKYNVPAENLLLEITENVAIENHGAVKNRILELKELGFSISIDDFGTGYSAFIYLQHFPIEEIKIDRQFIRNITTSDSSAAIVKTIIELGKTLGLRTVAEGVEQKEEWELLKKAGCDEIQGFYFSKPLPVDDIDALFKEQASTLYLP